MKGGRREDVSECTCNLSKESNYQRSQRSVQSQYLHTMQSPQDCISTVKLTL